MKQFYQDIFAYHHHFNQRLGDQIQSYLQQVTERTLLLFSHVILAHQVWNARIWGQEAMELHQTLPIGRCLDLDKTNFEITWKTLEEIDLAKIITYQNTKGQQFKNTVSEILFHLSNHSTHHKGQIVAELRHCGIAPVVTDYIFYKRRAEEID